MKFWITETPLIPRKKSRVSSIFITVFFCSLILWSFSNWPALEKSWLYLDDYYKIRGVANSFYNETMTGRPIQGLWYYSFFIDGNLDRPIENELLRLAQGAIHCLAATLAAYILWKQTGRWTALVSILPFLIWPFNGEAVLWRSTGAYPIAALFSVLGVFLIRFKGQNWFIKILGAICIAVAVLANQLAAFSGLVVWIIVFGLDIQGNKLISKLDLSQFLYIVSGYVIGGLSSTLLIRLFYPSFQRLNFVTDVFAKLKFLAQLNRWFILWPELYPGWIKILHVLLLAGSAGWFLWDAFHRKKTWQAALKPVLVIFALFVLPYAPLLLLAESWPSWRVMYLAPFLLVMAINVFDLGAKSYPVIRWAPLVFLGALMLGYIPIARENSSEYVRVYEEDRRVMAQVEVQAQEWGVDQVTVATFPDYIYNWNPYKLKYLHKDSKISAFQVNYCWYPFIEQFSDLKIVGGEVGMECAALCQAKERKKPFEFALMEGRDTVCVCVRE